MMDLIDVLTKSKVSCYVHWWKGLNTADGK